MCEFCTTNNYRKIFINHHGPIPVDQDGRKYDIHHIDGNHSNNNPSNLKAVPLQEHYDIHFSQGDFAACRAIAMRLKLNKEQISEIARKAALQRLATGNHPFLTPNFSKEVQRKRVENGTHHMLGGDLQRRLLAEGKNPFSDPNFTGKHSRARVANGTHNFLGSNNPVHKLIADGTHNFLGDKNPSRQKAQQGTHHWQDPEWHKRKIQKMRDNGTLTFKNNNPNNVKLTCPHCNKLGSKPGMLRYHFDNCKNKK